MLMVRSQQCQRLPRWCRLDLLSPLSGAVKQLVDLMYIFLSGRYFFYAPVTCTINYTNYLRHLITFTAMLLSSPPSSALILSYCSHLRPFCPLCILSTFINTIIHLHP